MTEETQRSASGRKVDDRFRLMLRLPPDLHVKVEAVARVAKISVNRYVTLVLEADVANRKRVG